MHTIHPHVSQQLVAERGRRLRREIQPVDRNSPAPAATSGAEATAAPDTVATIEADAGTVAPALAVSGRRRRNADDRVVELAAAAAAGDDRAWSTLVSLFGPVINAVAQRHRLNEADAADVAQLTWISLYKHIDRINDPNRLGAWLATTARRECLRTLRANGRQGLYGDDVPERESSEAAPDESMLAQERDRMLWRGVARLNARDQTLLGLLVSSSRPDYQAASRALGMPIGSIGPTRQRVLERLRGELETSGDLSLLQA